MTVEIPIQSKRRERVLLFQKVQHALPSFVLLGDGVQGLQGEHGWPLGLALAEIIVSVAVIASVTRTLRHLTKSRAHGPAHTGIDWIDIFLSAMLTIEAA